MITPSNILPAAENPRDYLAELKAVLESLQQKLPAQLDEFSSDYQQAICKIALNAYHDQETNFPAEYINQFINLLMKNKESFNQNKPASADRPDTNAVALAKAMVEETAKEIAQEKLALKRSSERLKHYQSKKPQI